MNETIQYNAINKPSEIQKAKIVDFLFTHLGEYGDPKKDILKAIEYAIKSFASFGGFVLTVEENDEIKGAVVINQTGMGGYIPENILVYIAVHDTMRGKGIGKLLMSRAIEYTQGDIALHVEAKNPAKKLYEKLGFTNPYLEMRLKK
ncbi:GNAT family N-acetyltransferase [Putridiphycobacter roseus]|uniref:GNAT family N-acetyltransferase n=1 Tax=Putridiphycobacter roseus TaxID=2219161 RepID=A0A2W1NQ89_9FLAO|nr:GNAT family N-acetyltransferase [Putridiphycobacter roseus]PZE17802.1 GNAT family N-acetyltransferase [Putridiphycobacter roseus]